MFWQKVICIHKNAKENFLQAKKTWKVSEILSCHLQMNYDFDRHIWNEGITNVIIQQSFNDFLQNIQFSYDSQVNGSNQSYNKLRLLIKHFQ